MLLHRSQGWVSAGEAAELEDVLGAAQLAKGDDGVIVVHLDAQVDG